MVKVVLQNMLDGAAATNLVPDKFFYYENNTDQRIKEYQAETGVDEKVAFCKVCLWQKVGQCLAILISLSAIFSMMFTSDFNADTNLSLLSVCLVAASPLIIARMYVIFRDEKKRD